MRITLAAGKELNPKRESDKHHIPAWPIKIFDISSATLSLGTLYELTLWVSSPLRSKYKTCAA